MSSEPKQRLGKGNAPASKPAAKPSVHRFSAEDHLDRAYTTVIRNKFEADKLHMEWRQHLQRISYLIVIVSFHQAQSPMTGCINDMKESNSDISGSQALGMVVYESMCEIVGILLTCSLALFLSLNPPGDFNSLPYKISVVLLPLQVGLYFQTKRMGCSGENVDLLDEDPLKRSFPIGIVFHLITTGAVWIIDKGNKKVNKNMKLVTDLKLELATANAAKKSKGEKEPKSKAKIDAGKSKADSKKK